MSRSRGAARVPLAWHIAWRYFRGQRSRLFSSTARAALAATALGVTAMVVAMALMTGYTEDLQRKLIGLQAEIIASPLEAGAVAETADDLEAILRWPEVAGSQRVSYGEGAILSRDLPEGLAVTLRGVDPLIDPVVGAAGGLARQPLAGVLLGDELARQLRVADGDSLRLVVVGFGGRRPRFRYRSVAVAGTFSTGFSEFDSRWAVLDRELLVALRGEEGLDILELKLVDPSQTEAVADRLEARLGDRFLVSDWQSLNRELFAALRMQQLVLFFLIGLIVAVAMFNVASSLVILIRERLRDVGVLACLGMTPGRLWGIFLANGLLLGGAGTVLGLTIGTAICWALTTFEVVRFGPEIAAIYFIDSVPFRVEASDLGAIVSFSLVLTVLACSVPAFGAARTEPSAALRYE